MADTATKKKSTTPSKPASKVSKGNIKIKLDSAEVWALERDIYVDKNIDETVVPISVLNTEALSKIATAAKMGLIEVSGLDYEEFLTEYANGDIYDSYPDVIYARLAKDRGFWQSEYDEEARLTIFSTKRSLKAEKGTILYKEIIDAVDNKYLQFAEAEEEDDAAEERQRAI